MPSEYEIRLKRPTDYAASMTVVQGPCVPRVNDIVKYLGEFYRVEAVVHSVGKVGIGGAPASSTVILNPNPVAAPFE